MASIYPIVAVGERLKEIARARQGTLIFCYRYMDREFCEPCAGMMSLLPIEGPFQVKEYSCARCNQEFSE